MPYIRLANWTLLVAAGFALCAAGPGLARQDKKDDLPRRPSNFSEVLTQKSLPLPPEKLPAAKAAFKDFAKYFADYVAHPRVYSAPQEFRPDGLASAVQPESIDALLNQLRDHIVVPVPNPPSGTRPTADNAAYIAELGAELDAAFSKVIKENSTPIVRVNATRMLAVAARSGALVHYDTVTELLTNANYPPEIKYYAFKAAEGLLAAYDFADYRSRRHSTLDKVKLGKLVKVVNDAVVAPAQLASGGEKEKEKDKAAPNAEQLAVHAFIRRGAVRALAQVRFASLEDDTKTLIYPSHTLARVATSDPALVPPPGPAEVAEAVIGLCNMTPQKGFNADTAAEAVGKGLQTFAGPRAGNPLDRSIAWKVYGARLSDALRTWRGLFDNTFDPANPTKFDAAAVPKSVNDVVQTGLTKILAPIDKSDVTLRVDLGGMSATLDELRRSTKRTNMLFTGVPKTALDGLGK